MKDAHIRKDQMVMEIEYTRDLYDKSKQLITKDVCMTFYDASDPLYLETDASDIGLRVILLQVRGYELWI